MFHLLGSSGASVVPSSLTSRAVALISLAVGEGIAVEGKAIVMAIATAAADEEEEEEEEERRPVVDEEDEDDEEDDEEGRRDSLPFLGCDFCTVCTVSLPLAFPATPFPRFSF